MDDMDDTAGTDEDTPAVSHAFNCPPGPASGPQLSAGYRVICNNKSRARAGGRAGGWAAGVGAPGADDDAKGSPAALPPAPVMRLGVGRGLGLKNSSRLKSSEWRGMGLPSLSSGSEYCTPMVAQREDAGSARPQGASPSPAAGDVPPSLPLLAPRDRASVPLPPPVKKYNKLNYGGLKLNAERAEDGVMSRARLASAVAALLPNAIGYRTCLFAFSSRRPYLWRRGGLLRVGRAFPKVSRGGTCRHSAPGATCELAVPPKCNFGLCAQWCANQVLPTWPICSARVSRKRRRVAPDRVLPALRDRGATAAGA